VRWYQVNRLGHADGETFLTEALPLPSPSTAHWPYRSLFTSREVYRAKVLPPRMQRLRSLYEEHRPQYVFCYGKDHCGDFEDVFAGVGFTDLESGRVRVGRANGRAIVLTHFFSSWFMTDQRVDRIAGHLEASR
jgi:hypothetical protein